LSIGYRKEKLPRQLIFLVPRERSVGYSYSTQSLPI